MRVWPEGDGVDAGVPYAGVDVGGQEGAQADGGAHYWDNNNNVGIE